MIKLASRIHSVAPCCCRRFTLGAGAKVRCSFTSSKLAPTRPALLSVTSVLSPLLILTGLHACQCLQVRSDLDTLLLPLLELLYSAHERTSNQASDSRCDS